MEEADLFMECEEEELEPWQQMNQAEAHDSYEGKASVSCAGFYEYLFIVWCW